MNRFEDFSGSVRLLLVTVMVGSLIVGIPVSSYLSAKVTRQALNEQCGTDYSVLDVLVSGEQLQGLCKMKNQELLIKQ